jgi:hypothetical protein
MDINPVKSYANLNKAVERAKELIADGADNVQIHGNSTSGVMSGEQNYFQFNVTGQFLGE